MIIRWIRRYFYANYRVFHRIQSWGGARFSPVGVVAFWAIPITGALALDGRSVVGYQGFTLFFLLFTSAVGLSALSRVRLLARRALPPFGVVGQPLRYQLWIRSASPREISGILAREIQRDPIPSLHEFTTLEEPGERRRNWVDRFYAYYRWKWLLERHRRIDTPAPQPTTIRPGADNRVEMTLTPRRRGSLDLSAIQLLEPDPFNLVYRLHTISAPATLLALPQRYPMPYYRFPGSRDEEETKQANQRAFNATEEFYGLRPYRPGDPLRHIHWRSAARQGALVVREFVEEGASRLGLFVDPFVPTERFEDFEAVVALAASIIYRLDDENERLERLLLGSEARSLERYGPRDRLTKSLEPLALAQPNAQTPFSEGVAKTLNHLQDLEGFVLILLGWDSDREAFVRNAHRMGIPCGTIVALPTGCRPPNPDEAPGRIQCVHIDNLEIETAKLS